LEDEDMSAFQALDAARAAGVEVRLDGNDLVLSAAGEAATDVMDMLRRHKLSIVALLQQDLRQKRLLHLVYPWDPDDWRAYFEERAAIIEYDSRLPRAQAEARSFDCCVAEWLLRNPIDSTPERCLECGKPARPDSPLLAIGVVGAGQAWLHRDCVSAWHSARMAAAVVALSAMNIAAPASTFVTSDEPTLVTKMAASIDQTGSEARGARYPQNAPTPRCRRLPSQFPEQHPQHNGERDE
jgi:hypothetical protein